MPDSEEGVGRLGVELAALATLYLGALIYCVCRPPCWSSFRVSILSVMIPSIGAAGLFKLWSHIECITPIVVSLASFDKYILKFLGVFQKLLRLFLDVTKIIHATIEQYPSQLAANRIFTVYSGGMRSQLLEI